MAVRACPRAAASRRSGRERDATRADPPAARTPQLVAKWGRGDDQKTADRQTRGLAWPQCSGSCHCLPVLRVCSGLAATHVPHLHEFCSAIGARAALPATS